MKFGAVILCGGNSKRMGTNKALLDVCGETFLNRIASTLSGFGELILSANSFNNFPDTNFRYTAIADLYPNCGPMGGIYSALKCCSSDALLVLSCDVPLFRHELGEYLCSRVTQNIDAIVPVTADGQFQPLCAVYRKTATHEFENFLKSGNLCIHDALKNLRVDYVQMSKTPYSEIWLRNINTPEEYSFLCEREMKK